MLSIDWESKIFRGCSFDRGLRSYTYSEGLDVIHGDLISAEMEQGILKHASMAVAAEVSVWTSWRIHEKQHFSKNMVHKELNESTWRYKAPYTIRK